MTTARRPSPARVVEVLKDGTWDRCELIELADGTRRVRKSTKSTGPWGIHTLRAEILYLQALPTSAAEYFPGVLAAWGLEPHAADVGYEMPYYEGSADAGSLVANGTFFQKEADAIQDDLAEIVFKRLHRPEPARQALAPHLEEVIQQALTQLGRMPEFSELIRAGEIVLNGQRIAGPGRAFQTLHARGDVARLMSGPAVLLHGDLILENVLWRTDPSPPRPRLVLLDPVSVAGVAHGPPVFDLVKYESYATGELFALREGLVVAEPEETARGGLPAFRFRITWEDPRVRPFRMLDLHTRFRKAYAARHGHFARAAYRLLEAYFALVMALNTEGLRRWARVLKAAEGLHEAAKGR